MRGWLIGVAALVVLGALYSALWSTPRRAGVVEDEADVAAAPSAPAAAPAGAGRDPAAQAVQAQAAPGAAEPDVAPIALRNPTSLLMTSFAQEPRDALWADRKEREVREVLADEQLPDDLVQSASCRTTVCRIELQWSPNSNQGYARLSQLVGQHWAPQIGIEYPPDARERRALTLYIIREGYTLDDVAP